MAKDEETYTAEDVKFYAEAELFHAQAREAAAKAKTAELALKDKRRTDRLAAASNDRNHVLHFEHPVRDTQPVREKLDAWHRLDQTRTLDHRVRTAPAASVIDGMALYDHIAAYSIRGGGTHHITSLTRGYSASMAGILAQAADTRKLVPRRT